MTGTEWAAIIAAVAFLIIAIALAYFLVRSAKVVQELETTVNELNRTLDTVTTDANRMMIEVEGLLNKSNTTLSDVNGKMTLLDPVFQAAGDLGQTVSDLNRSTRQLTDTLTSFNTKTAKRKKGEV